MSKALSDLEDFFDGMVGDDEGFAVVAGAIEEIRYLTQHVETLGKTNSGYKIILLNLKSAIKDLWEMVP